MRGGGILSCGYFGVRPVLSSARAGNLLSCQFAFGHANNSNNNNICKRNSKNNKSYIRINNIKLFQSRQADNNNNKCSRQFWATPAGKVIFQFQTHPQTDWCCQMDFSEKYPFSDMSHGFSPCVIFCHGFSPCVIFLPYGFQLMRKIPSNLELFCVCRYVLLCPLSSSTIITTITITITTITTITSTTTTSTTISH